MFGTILSIRCVVHVYGQEQAFPRQRGNRAFSLFLMILRFAKHEDVFRMFTSSTCETIFHDGTNRIDWLS